jgi:site-specific DNA recombinase
MASRITKKRTLTRGRVEPTSATKRVAVYLRRSTDEEHQPYSIEVQQTRLDHYIASQPGWTKTHTFTDNASAKDTNRPGLQAALAAARSGRIDVLLVLKVDRFSRRQRDLVSLVEELTEIGVAFVSATEAFDTSTPAGRAMLQMLGTFAEFEREMIRERVISGMERHAADGKWFGGIVPYGYTLNQKTKKLTPAADRSTIVREIFRLYTTARLGTQAISRVLNARGLRTRTGGPWSARTIAGILTNRVYLGEITFRGATVTGAHPPLIDEATFNQAVALMDARGEDHTRRASNASDYHLTGRIRCPRCGKALIGTAATGRTKTYRYYTCWSRARYGTDTCNGHRMNADTLDQAIFDALARFYRDHTNLIKQAITHAATAHLDQQRDELTAIEKELTRAHSAIDRYLQAFEDGHLDPGQVTDRLHTLKHKINQLTARRDELADLLADPPNIPPAAVLDDLSDHIAEIIRSGNTAQRKTLIEALVDEVKITGPDTIVPVFRVPQSTSRAHKTPEHTEAAAALPATTASDTMVRTMVEPMGDTGIEPVTSARVGMPSRLPISPLTCDFLGTCRLPDVDTNGHQPPNLWARCGHGRYDPGHARTREDAPVLRERSEAAVRPVSGAVHSAGREALQRATG